MLDTPLVTMGTVWCHSVVIVWGNDKGHGRDSEQTPKA